MALYSMKRIEQPIKMHVVASGNLMVFLWERRYPLGHKEPGEYIHIKEVLET